MYQENNQGGRRMNIIELLHEANLTEENKRKYNNKTYTSDTLLYYDGHEVNSFKLTNSFTLKKCVPVSIDKQNNLLFMANTEVEEVSQEVDFITAISSPENKIKSCTDNSGYSKASSVLCYLSYVPHIEYNRLINGKWIIKGVE